ncbi:MAG: T9SS type A sorting domain-containing protein [Flavobacterium sp.]|nr:T9SS type A sorting domain-containing protein [Flavobacterium sp.]
MTIDTKESIRTIQVIGMNGSNFSPKLNDTKVDLTEVSTGLYLLHVTFNNSKTKTVKFWKK